jgi:hypothetical protein
LDDIDLRWTLKDIAANRTWIINKEHLAQLVDLGLVEMRDDAPLPTPAGQSAVFANQDAAPQRARLSGGGLTSMRHQTNFRTCSFVVATAIVAASCSQEPELTDAQRACIAQRYAKYDATNLNQCVVNVCQACMSGTTATCNTSCKLRARVDD